MHSFRHTNLTITVFDSVYEPAEDSFLLASIAPKLRGSVLEIGCGTGIVSLTAAKIKKNKIVAVDISNDALKNAKYNAQKNKLTNIEFVKSNLFSSKKLNGRKFDYILCNPPYLPTNKEERIHGVINHAYDGGKDGRKILDKVLQRFTQYLKKEGTLFLIHSSLQNIEKTRNLLAKKRYKLKIHKELSFFFEKIYLVSIVERE